jgi:hypothetical protein
VRIVSAKDFIADVEDMLDADTCAAIIERFEASAEVHDGRVFHMDHGDARSQDKVSVDLSIPTEGEWQALHADLHASVSAAVSQVIADLPGLLVDPLGCTGYKVQKYPRGQGHFTWHVDTFGQMAQSRLLALVLYLNDVEVGGETEFHHQERLVTPRTGRGILFPTSWTHMHRGRVPESGDKYVVSTFFEFSR